MITAAHHFDLMGAPAKTVVKKTKLAVRIAFLNRWKAANKFDVSGVHRLHNHIYHCGDHELEPNHELGPMHSKAGHSTRHEFHLFSVAFFFNFIFLLTFSFDLSEIAQPVAKINIYTQKKNIFMFFSV